MAEQFHASNGQKEGEGIVINSGELLTIETAADFARRIGAALAVSQQVTVNFAAKVEMDVTALQTLCSACKTAAAEGKILTQQGVGTDSLRQLIAAAGAQLHGPCKHNNSNPCIWFGGEQ
jgi:ABC-type transporter Mla MlaB component